MEAVAHAPDVRDYDVILVNSSAGKDSQATLDVVFQAASAAGVVDRVVVVHADMGRVEWEGTLELAREQATHYGLRFVSVARGKGDLLSHVESRGKWPGPGNARFCTSDHKRDQIVKVMTALVKEAGLDRAVKILNCMGMRAQESPDRAKLNPFAVNRRASNGRREVHDWLPIHGWTEDQVWERIRSAGTRSHGAYGLGMPRLSCVFCIYSTRDGLLLAGHHNRGLLEEYVRVEKKIGHDFKHRLPIASVRDDVMAGVRPSGPVRTWCM